MSVRKCEELKDRILVAVRGNHISEKYSDDLLRAMRVADEHHGYEHARWRDWRADLREDYTAFAIVRNPWARTASRYTFAVKIGDSSGKKTFREFLQERHKYGDRPFYWHRAVRGWYPQVDYVTDLDGELRCDVLRLEHLPHDLEQYTGVTYYKRHNVSDTGRKMLGIKDYRELYGPEEFDIVADWYEEDIDYFGFSFDGAATKHIWHV